jgi:hypothetical protein
VEFRLVTIRTAKKMQIPRSARDDTREKAVTRSQSLWLKMKVLRARFGDAGAFLNFAYLAEIMLRVAENQESR